MVVGYPQWIKMVQTACCKGQLVKCLLLSCWIQFCKSTMVSWSHPAQPVLELILHITASCETLHRSQAPTLTPDCSHCSVEAKSPSNRQQLKSSHSHNRFKPSENIQIRISIQRFFAFSSFYFTVLLVDHRVQLFPPTYSY